MGEARENLGKYIQLKDDEKKGAKRGYVKDKSLAERAADTEEWYREGIKRRDGEEAGLSPEEANRVAEKTIKKGVGVRVARDNILEQMNEWIEKGEDSPGFIGPVIDDEEASEKGVEAEKEYEKFIIEKDAEDIDKLRVQIRTENQ